MDKQLMLKGLKDSDEKLAFAKVLDSVLLCQKGRKQTFTDFLDPIKTHKFISLIKSNKSINVDCLAFGGSESCERKIIGFSTFEDEIIESNFPIKKLHISYNTKYSKTLTHRDYLGSILGLGIIRQKIGDIIINEENGAFVFVYSDIADYIAINLDKVGRTKVSVSICNDNFIVENESLKEEIKLTVSSLRLDVVISAAFKLSRSQTSKHVDSEKVFINWALITNSSKQINEQDIITVRGVGRIKINSFIGKSKKDKYIISLTKY